MIQQIVQLPDFENIPYIPNIVRKITNVHMLLGGDGDIVTAMRNYDVAEFAGLTPLAQDKKLLYLLLLNYTGNRTHTLRYYPPPHDRIVCEFCGN